MGGSKVDGAASCLSDLPQFTPDRRWGEGEVKVVAEVEAEPDLMTRALSGAATLIRIGPSQTIAGVTGP